MFFENFPQVDIDIVSKDGEMRHHTKALFGKKGKATLPDPNLVINVGDEFRRILPNGQEETFEVTDYVFHEIFHAIPAHYDVDINRRGVFPRRSGGNYNFVVSGPNARVNFQSHDQSTNIANDGQIFSQMIAAISESNVVHVQKEAMLEAVEAMKAAGADRSVLLSSYQRLISSAAQHITIVAPFLPALAHLISG